MKPSDSSLPSPASRLQPPAWIISPTADLVFLVGTPLAIVPLVTWLVDRVLTAEQLNVIVAAFASLGHHLPGFMRCYGDRELFARYRWRFLLTPPLFLAISAGFVSWQLHGLTVVLLLWGTWHGLMQTYGMMRIYDLKNGWNDRRTAWSDFSLCLAMFGAGIVWSDARVHGLMAVLWQSGLPELHARWLVLARWWSTVACAGVLFAYVSNMVRQWRLGQAVSRVKLLVALSTGLLYWISGTVVTNLLVGIAMFEIFHAIQYDAIVWKYNRRLAERAGQQFGPLGFLFRDRWLMLGLYLAAIVAYGAIRYFGDGWGAAGLPSALVVMISASTLLHFYTDGFIWKVSESRTRANLDLDQGGAVRMLLVPAWAHVGKVVVLLAILAGLARLELTAPTSRQRATWLADWLPALPEVQGLLIEDAIARGEPTEAIRIARRVAERRPGSYQARLDLGGALLAGGDLAGAIENFRSAVSAAPLRWEGYYHLAGALERSGRADEARQLFGKATSLNARDLNLQWEFVSLLARSGDTEAAGVRASSLAVDRRLVPDVAAATVVALADAGVWDESLRLAQLAATTHPDSAVLQRAWAAALVVAGDPRSALARWKEAAELDPTSADTFYRWGLAELQLDSPLAAEQRFAKAARLAPEMAEAHFQWGNACHASGRYRAAADEFRRAVELKPEWSAAWSNLGAALTEIPSVEEAESAYWRAIEVEPEHPGAHYNLGLLMLRGNRIREAREQILEAIRLGQQPSEEVARDLGLGLGLAP